MVGLVGRPPPGGGFWIIGVIRTSPLRLFAFGFPSILFACLASSDFDESVLFGFGLFMLSCGFFRGSSIMCDLFSSFLSFFSWLVCLGLFS